jgi:glutamyl endopeptidase
MSTNTTIGTEHEPVSNFSEATAPQQFFSTPPSFGGDNRRHPVDAGGFEALEGFQMPAAAPPQERVIRAASELTFPPPAVAAVAGPPAAPPNRIAVVDTTKYPSRANAALLTTLPNGEKIYASGWFVGPYAVITAAHAIYPRQAGGYTGWASSVEVIPGLNGFPNSRPYGSVISQKFYCPTAWQNGTNPNLDYGVVLLNQALGQTVGTFGFATYATADLSSAVANLGGYPVVSPDQSEPQGRQWYGAANVSQVSDSLIYYDLGTRPGDSGSCVYRNIGNQCYAMAIHTSDQGVNSGVRITAPVHANLTAWRSMQG